MTELFISFFDGEGEIHVVGEGNVNFKYLKDKGIIDMNNNFLFVKDLDNQFVGYNINNVRSIELRYNNKNDK